MTPALAYRRALGTTTTLSLRGDDSDEAIPLRTKGMNVCHEIATPCRARDDTGAGYRRALGTTTTLSLRGDGSDEAIPLRTESHEHVPRDRHALPGSR
jgi:hypothetical protein